MQQKANLGNSIILGLANAVHEQYAPLGARADWTSVFDTPLDPDDTQLRIFTIMTWLGNYALPAPEVTGRHLAVLGRVEWGIGGTSFQADFDWKMGTQFNLIASFVRVSAAYSEVGPAVPQNGVKIGAMVSSGSRAARAQVTRSYPQLVITGGEESENATVLFPVPPFAHALNLFAEEAAYADGAITVRYLGGASAGFSAPSTDLVSFTSDGRPFLAALGNEDGVRFPECTRFVEVTAIAESTFAITPCFTLSL